MKKIYLLMLALFLTGRVFAISAITGPTVMCSGSCITLSDATTGGTWSSSATSVATISITTGMLCGVAPGTTMVTYTVGSAYATATIVIEPIPAGITGPSSVCVGSTVTVTDAVGGGTWYSAGGPLTISPTTGVVTGVSAGTSVITYFVSGGCLASTVMAVDPAPAPISGTPSICDGSTIPLTDLSSGGVWSSADPTVATVISGSGLVAGVSPGTSIISYTLSTGCSAEAAVTVNPIPAPITGPATLCIGGYITLADATTGGTWASSFPTVAAVSSSGLVAALSPGYTNISYTLSSGCAAIQSVTVIPGPTAITGATSVCDGSTATLTDGIGGGTWSSSIPSVATVGSTSGVYTGITIGTTVMSYTTGCGTVTTTIFADPLPTVYSITGGGPYCMGGTGVSIGTSASGTGTTYTLFDGSSVVSTVVGTGAAMYFGGITSAGSYHIEATSTAGCSVILSDTVTVTINPLPTIYAVSGGGGYCTGGSGMAILLSNSDLGVSYKLMDGSTTVSTLAGDGGSLSFGPITTAGTYTVTATNATTTCSDGMTGSATITIEALPTITSSSATAVCGSTDTVIAAGGVTYSWSPSAGLSCATCGTTYISPTATTTYTVTGTNSSGCSNTSTVTLAANRIYGNITFSSTAPDTLDTKVWLIQFNSSDSSIVALDSVTTCTAGTVPYFEFGGQPAGNYMVKAKLIYGDYAGTSGYVPTYSSSTPHWDSAATVAHTSGSDELDINMVYGTVPTGPGFISGYVTSGAGRGTSGDVPAVDVLIYLENTASHVLTYTFTDVTGYYSFGSLANSSYIIYPEDYDYNTIPSSVITLSTTSEVAEAVDFKQHTTTHVISPYIFTTGIAAATSSNNLNMYPNPTSGSLNIEWNDQVSGKADFVITDLIGREVYRSVVDMNATAGQANIELNGLNDGMYIVKIQSASIDYSNKLIIQH